jgi:hypothetical protein
MGEPKFFQTKRGRIFYERDVPNIANSLKSIAENLEEKDKLKNYFFETSKVDDGVRVGMDVDYKKNPLIRVEEDLEENVINIYIWEKDQEDFTKKIQVEKCML